MDSYFKTLITGVNNIDELKQRITDSKLEFKEDEYLMLIFSPTNSRTENDLDNSIKSVIIDKKTLTPIATQFNKLFYNNDTINFISSKNWENVKIKYCYEGTMILVFYMYDQWYFCTRKCLDAKKSSWIKGISYYDLFVESINGKFSIDELDKNNCYHFIIVHHKNKNIVDYTHELGHHYKNIVLAMTSKLKTFERIEYFINDKIIYSKTLQFNNISEVEHYLKEISENDTRNKVISTEGLIFEFYENNVLTLLKLQTPIYKYISELKPNVSNVNSLLLELYQKNKLCELAPFFTNQSGIVITRIHNAMKTISQEILNIYHATRSHKDEKLYEILPSSYKCVLYAIHGIYIEKRKKEQQQNKVSELGDHKSITVHDVYNYLKIMEPHYLRSVFIDRLSIISNPLLNNFFDKFGIDAMFQGTLMK